MTQLKTIFKPEELCNYIACQNHLAEDTPFIVKNSFHNTDTMLLDSVIKATFAKVVKGGYNGSTFLWCPICRCHGTLVCKSYAQGNRSKHAMGYKCTSPHCNNSTKGLTTASIYYSNPEMNMAEYMFAASLNSFNAVITTSDFRTEEEKTVHPVPSSFMLFIKLDQDFVVKTQRTLGEQGRISHSMAQDIPISHFDPPSDVDDTPAAGNPGKSASFAAEDSDEMDVNADSLMESAAPIELPATPNNTQDSGHAMGIRQNWPQSPVQSRRTLKEGLEDSSFELIDTSNTGGFKRSKVVKDAETSGTLVLKFPEGSGVTDFHKMLKETLAARDDDLTATIVTRINQANSANNAQLVEKLNMALEGAQRALVITSDTSSSLQRVQASFMDLERRLEALETKTNQVHVAVKTGITNADFALPLAFTDRKEALPTTLQVEGKFSVRLLCFEYGYKDDFPLKDLATFVRKSLDKANAGGKDCLNLAFLQNGARHFLELVVTAEASGNVAHKDYFGFGSRILDYHPLMSAVTSSHIATAKRLARQSARPRARSAVINLFDDLSLELGIAEQYEIAKKEFAIKFEQDATDQINVATNQPAIRLSSQPANQSTTRLSAPAGLQLGDQAHAAQRGAVAQ